jgi:hypothetical protein
MAKADHADFSRVERRGSIDVSHYVRTWITPDCGVALLFLPAANHLRNLASTAWRGGVMATVGRAAHEPEGQASTNSYIRPFGDA